MTTITLKNIPDELHQRLKERASRHHRSLNSEIIASLEAILRSEPLDPTAYIARIRSLRPSGHETLTLEDFDALKNEGRA